MGLRKTPKIGNAEHEKKSRQFIADTLGKPALERLDGVPTDKKPGTLIALAECFDKLADKYFDD
jgi:hypothetical protein